MKATRSCLILGLAAVVTPVVALSAAPPAAANPTTNCQSGGAATVCAQGGVTGQSSVTGPSSPIGGTGHYGVEAPYGQGCTSAYGTYQNCAVEDEFFGIRFAR